MASSYREGHITCEHWGLGFDDGVYLVCSEDAEMRPHEFRAWGMGKMVYGPKDGERNASWVLALKAAYGDKIKVMELSPFKTGKGEEVWEGDIIDKNWAMRFYDGYWSLCNPPDEDPATAAKEEVCLEGSTVTGHIFEGK